jgi:hypothetical protein
MGDICSPEGKSGVGHRRQSATYAVSCSPKSGLRLNHSLDHVYKCERFTVVDLANTAAAIAHGIAQMPARLCYGGRHLIHLDRLAS